MLRATVSSESRHASLTKSPVGNKDPFGRSPAQRKSCRRATIVSPSRARSKAGRPRAPVSCCDRHRYHADQGDGALRGALDHVALLVCGFGAPADKQASDQESSVVGRLFCCPGICEPQFLCFLIPNACREGTHYNCIGVDRLTTDLERQMFGVAMAGVMIKCESLPFEKNGHCSCGRPVFGSFF